MTSPDIVDVKLNCCRLCGKHKFQTELKYIFKEENLAKSIERYIQLMILPEDSLSHYICFTCETKTKSTLQFVTDVREAQKVQLREKNKANQESSPIPHYVPDHIKKEESIEDEPIVVYENDPLDMSESKTMKYTWSIQGVPEVDNGGPNTSVTILMNNHSEWTAFSALSTPDQSKLKKLGKMIYNEYYDEIVNMHHVTKTFSEIRKNPATMEFFGTENELENLQDPLREGIAEPIILNCSDCPFTASKYWYLNQHYNDAHAKPFSCNQCGKAFGHASKLRAHFEAEHSDCSTLVCNFCNEKFTQKYSYTKHLKTHMNNDQLWPCDECNMQFRQLCKLNLHKSRFHKSEQLPCLHCPTFFAKSKHHLKQHVREVHRKSFECNECGKKLSKKSRLLKHIQNKHGQKITYNCQYCHSKYTSKKWYEVHITNCPCAI